MISRLLQQFVNDVAWGEQDILVVDLPPGTGDIQLTLAQSLPITGVVIVTTPQNVALADATKAAAMFRKIEVPIVGLVENMSTFECPSCHHHTAIFTQGGGTQRALDLDIPFLGSVPLEPATVTASDQGVPIAQSRSDSGQAQKFKTMAQTIWQTVVSLQERKASTTNADAGESFEV
jgi:ATP-binding protein involved in chromosome partitioning